MDQPGVALTATLSDGIERVDGDIVLSKTGQRFLAARHVVKGHQKLDLEPLTTLETYDQIIARQTLYSGYSGWFALGAEDSKLIRAWADCGYSERCLNTPSVPLPMLDGLGDIQDAVVIDLGAGCALRAQGRIDCWDAEGKPTVRRHAADGRARQLVASEFEGLGSGICATTKDTIVCEDFASESTHTIRVAGVREVSEYDGRLCAVGDAPGVVCLRTVLRESVPTQVASLPPVRQLTHGNKGWCAVTEAGALVCWGDPFSPHQSKVVGGVQKPGHPYASPTTIIPTGVEGFWMADEGGAWCISREGTTRCEGLDWERDLTENETIFELGLSTLCTISAGRPRCLESEHDGYTPRLRDAAGRQPVTAIGLGSFLETGCLSRGQEVTCWVEFDSADLRHTTLPAPIANLAISNDDQVVFLEDGRVMSRADPDEKFETIPDLRLTDFHPHGSRWTGVTETGVACGVGEDVRHVPWPGARWAECNVSSGCLLDEEGGVYCWGAQSHGETGHGWSPLGLARVPMRPGESIGTVE
ncbi:hypothetical protein [Enhygromyxa salina]|uniref:hypothetical protein n=1 Tax=Enhygromyxa salina TaxID=215803 RepID=UPI0011BAB436|nr:hypothetical protein [Enhygromyxa salina]